jgi:hypothetical protein
VSVIEQIEAMGDPWQESMPTCHHCGKIADPRFLLCEGCREAKWREMRQRAAWCQWEEQAEAERSFCGRTAKVGAALLAAWVVAPFAGIALRGWAIGVGVLIVALCMWRARVTG